jgi:hypothetical protein
VKLVGTVAVVTGGLLGFLSVSAFGSVVASRRAAAPLGSTVVIPAAGSETTGGCDHRNRLADLAAMESRLARRIEELTAADAVARFLPPRDLPARFAGPAVGWAVTAAIAGSGLAGRVEEIDCSSYPCLVVGRYARADQIGRLQRGLRNHPEYAGDVSLVMPMGNDPSDGQFALIGAIVFPHGEPRAAEILAAFRRRRAEVLERRAAGHAVVEPRK